MSREKEIALFSLNQSISSNLLSKDENMEKIREQIYKEILQESDVRELVNKIYPPSEDGIEYEILPLDWVKNKRIEKLKEECSNEIYSGFIATNGHEYGFNQNDQGNMTQQLLLIVQGDTSDIYWKTKDSGVVLHTTEEFQQVTQDAKNHKLTLQQKYWQLESEILNAVSSEEVMDIVW